MPRRPDIPCAQCGQLMWRSTTSLPEGQATCRPCRREAPVPYRPYPHGTASGYTRGCRCDECKNASSAARLDRMARRVSEGILCHVPGCTRAAMTKGQCPTHYTQTRKARRTGKPGMGSTSWIRPATRYAIYTRDDWTCYLCDQPVLRGGDKNANLAPSLDHLVPRAHGGTHDQANLRTAHRICNTRRWMQEQASAA